MAALTLDEIATLWAYTLAHTLPVLALAALVYFVYNHVWRSPKAFCAGEITAIYIYPLKSARGVSVKSATLDERGLEFDRLWMAVDDDGTFLSQRRAPKLALIEVSLPKTHADPLQLRAPGAPPLSVPVVHEVASTPTTSVRCWDDQCDAVDQGDEAAAWLATVLGVRGARLVRMAKAHRRTCSPNYARAGSTTGFSDGFPILLANDASLAELCRRLVARGKAPVPMNRFRPNLVFGGKGGKVGEGGAPPFAEDSWAAVAVGLRGDLKDGGATNFGVVKPCARCKMPTIDQETGVPDGRRDACAVVKGSTDDGDEGGGPAAGAEPTATMRTFRTGKLLGFKKAGWRADVFFGQNIVPVVDAVGREVSVGDEVMATPRRPRGLWSRGLRGVDY
jgi:hypothetical protein